MVLSFSIFGKLLFLEGLKEYDLCLQKGNVLRLYIVCIIRNLYASNTPDPMREVHYLREMDTKITNVPEIN